MKKLWQKHKKATTLILMLSLVMAGFLLGAAAPGSSSDPLVTRSWVDSYVNHKCDALEKRVDNLSAAIGGGNELCLWIGKTTITTNGVQSKIDAAPALVNNRTVLPLRYVGEAIGADFKWDNTAKKVTYIKGSTKIELWINKNTIKVNGANKSIDTAPTLINGRTMVPLRFVVENLGAKVKWDNTEKKVTVIY
ncbi:MAG: copper amine oxidase N-terminal domain-containing protein [Bacillota bacterium]|jgi:hypothetical protein